MVCGAVKSAQPVLQPKTASTIYLVAAAKLAGVLPTRMVRWATQTSSTMVLHAFST